MVTTSTNPHYAQQDASAPYMVAEGGSQAYGWVESISIEDEDLMFGGKSLSAWHEEDRQKVSFPEEEKRGRQRVSVLRKNVDLQNVPMLTINCQGSPKSFLLAAAVQIHHKEPGAIEII